MSLLITRPRYDNGTHYLFHWAQKFIDKADEKNMPYFDITKKKVTRKKVQSYIKKQSPQIIIFNGHGNSVSVLGHDNKEIISVKNGSDLFRDKVVFIRACDAGKELGPKIMQTGARGFIGYKEVFMFPFDKNKFSKPLEDELALPFFECSNEVGLSLIKGQTVNKSHKNSLKKYKEYYEKMLTSESTTYQDAWILFWNMNNQVCYSNEDENR